jgi:hypothetical protein
MFKLKRGYFVRAIFLAFAIAIVPSMAFVRASYAQERSHQESVLAALDKSGYAYTKAKDGVWVVEIDGKHLAKIEIIVSSGGDMAVVSADVVDRKVLTGREPVLVKILELNAKIDSAKMALSKNTLYARAEIQVGLIDGKELAYLINQVAGMADDAYRYTRQ